MFVYTKIVCLQKFMDKVSIYLTEFSMSLTFNLRFLLSKIAEKKFSFRNYFSKSLVCTSLCIRKYFGLFDDSHLATQVW